VSENPLLDFHEASIVSVTSENSDIVLELEGGHFGEKFCDAKLRLIGVKEILRDGIVVENFVAEFSDGEIVSLEHSETTIKLIIEWPDFVNHRRATNSYRIISAAILTEVHCRTSDSSKPSL